jgi:hypothetical protein
MQNFVSSMSPAPVLQIRAVALGTPKEVRTPSDHEPVQLVICRVSVEVGQVVDESLPVEVERGVAQDSVSGACFQSDGGWQAEFRFTGE